MDEIPLWDVRINTYRHESEVAVFLIHLPTGVEAKAMGNGPIEPVKQEAMKNLRETLEKTAGWLAGGEPVSDPGPEPYSEVVEQYARKLENDLAYAAPEMWAAHIRRRILEAIEDALDSSSHPGAS